MAGQAGPCRRRRIVKTRDIRYDSAGPAGRGRVAREGPGPGPGMPSAAGLSGPEHWHCTCLCRKINSCDSSTVHLFKLWPRKGHEFFLVVTTCIISSMSQIIQQIKAKSIHGRSSSAAELDIRRIPDETLRLVDMVMLFSFH